MLPLTEFPIFEHSAEHPVYEFINPLAIEFGFWGALVWTFYFITCFYFSVLEPEIRFFELPLIKFINCIVIIGNTAFTAFLLLRNLPWYLPDIENYYFFYLVVFASIFAAVYFSTKLKYVRILSLASSFLFFTLIIFLYVQITLFSDTSVGDIFLTFTLIKSYFENIHYFILPIDDYHEFYLFWWLSWSIMIGQFTSRFINGLPVWLLFLVMLVVPSILIAIWFSGLYFIYSRQIDVNNFYHITMVFVGVVFVVSSLDSLIRVYTDALKMTVNRLGEARYIIGNVALLSLLTFCFKLDFLRIHWVGSLVIGLFFTCFVYTLFRQRIHTSAIDVTNLRG